MRPDLWNTSGVFGGCFFREGTPVLPRLPTGSLAGEEYRSLALKVASRRAAASSGDSYVLAVTSAEPFAGKTLTSINLAAALAGSEKSVLLIEADLRRPCFREYLEFHRSLKGLFQLLTEEPKMSECLAKSFEVPGLEVVTAGTAGDSGEILLGNRMTEVLDEIKRRFEIVLLDLPPYFLASSRALAALADDVLVVVRANQTQPAGLEEVLRDLGPEKMMGFVMNGATLASTHYGSYYLGAADQANSRNRGKQGRGIRWSAVIALLALALFAGWSIGRLRTTPASEATVESVAAIESLPAADSGPLDAVPAASSSSETLPTSAGPETARTTTRLNLRTAPKLDSRVITTLPEGTELKIVEVDGEWRHVRSHGADGLEGWAHASGLEFPAALSRLETGEPDGE